MRIRDIIKKQDVVFISVLILAALFVGVYLILTTVMISKDGTTFIGYASYLESEPVKIMVEQDQHPGYPAMILGMYKITRMFSSEGSIFSWIYSAQVVALLFRLLGIVLLYFIGKILVGRVNSFLAVLIFIFLPGIAEYGSDALSDWPNLCFLLLSMLVLLKAAKGNKVWCYILVGLTAGVGYLIRPECAVVVVCGGLWLSVQFIFSRGELSRPKAVGAMVLLVVGFLAMAGPYMYLKGAIFPKKHVGEFVVEQKEILESYPLSEQNIQTANILKGGEKLISNVGEILMWYYLPVLLLGLFINFRKIDIFKVEYFLPWVFIVFNILLMFWLYERAGYMSRRHTMPLMALFVLYVPSGLGVLSTWLGRAVFKAKKRSGISGIVVLTVIGILICLPKLVRPINNDKKSYVKAARWLNKNTDGSDVLAVPDIRISFYAGRRGIDYLHYSLEEEVDYVVRVFKSLDDPMDVKLPGAEAVLYSDRNDKKYKVDIYRPVK